MTGPFAASINQQDASNPAESVWVSANAGSGKTYVLVDRVIRLMLEGTEPSRILCLTFTKAAAAEMSNRLFKKLALWTTLPDDLLNVELKAIGHNKAHQVDFGRARKLFTLTLESPGGLKVQTIHAFCERLLQLFPVEAGVVPGFTVMDDVTANATLAEARQGLLGRITAEDRYGKALEGIVSRLQADTFDDLVKKYLDKRLEVADVMGRPDAIEQAIAEFHQRAGLGPEQTKASVRAGIADTDVDAYQNAISVLSSGTAKTDASMAEALSAVIAESDARVRLGLLQDIYLTKSLTPYAASKLITKNLAKVHPDAQDFLLAEQRRVFEGLGNLSLFALLDANRHLMTLASGIVAEYKRLKRQRGQYDFTDLIERTRNLLLHSGSAAWVLYKLDGGIDHILVDEAQDTSRAQWEIARTLTEEPFSGTGARSDVSRTIFVVGDRKQSIFSFQGADPASFDESRLHFEQLIAGAGRQLNPVELFDSYRSVPAVLKVVDQVFADPDARKGLEVSSDIAVHHHATRQNQPGIVELWPLLEYEKLKAPHPLDAVDAKPRNHRHRRQAAEVAARIASWIGKRTIPALGRLVDPGDILILVRRRNLLFESMIAELNGRGVPVAGADRLKLGRHIAVQDLLSLARFVLLPEDDLSLAEVLKSPLLPGALDDDALYGVAHDRGVRSLWASLRESRHKECVRLLNNWRERGEFLSPFEFFNHVLLSGNPSGRKRFYARLGPEAADAIDAFLSRCLDDEMRGTPSLQGFVSRFEAEEIEIRRNMEPDGGEVRIMTIHGAKGLEANIVVIPDAADMPRKGQDTALLLVAGDERAAPLSFWCFNAGVEPAVVTKWKLETRERSLEEYRRNLYVALTRARDELYIGGVESRGDLDPGCWYALVRNGLRQLVEPDADGGYRYHDGAAIPFIGAQEKRDSNASQNIPGWVFDAPSRNFRDRPWLRPSDPLPPTGDGTGRSPLDPNEIRRFRRGTLIHKLLQLLPELDEAKWSNATETFLRRHHTEAADAAIIRDEVIELLRNCEFAVFFAPGSLAEVSVASLLGQPETHVSGRIDRLAITEDAVHLLDFKTDRNPPQAIEAVDPAYIEQLSIYVRALRQIFPDKKVNAALLWTVTPRLMVIPDAVLNRHFRSANSLQ